MTPPQTSVLGCTTCRPKVGLTRPKWWPTGLGVVIILGSRNTEAERRGSLLAGSKHELVQITPSDASFVHEGHSEGHEYSSKVGLGGKVLQELRNEWGFGVSDRGMLTNQSVSHQGTNKVLKGAVCTRKVV